MCVLTRCIRVKYRCETQSAEAMADGAACPKRVIIDTDYAFMDTGGTEAMVQLAAAVASLCPNATYRGFRAGRYVINADGLLHPRLTAVYPEVARLPRLSHTDDLRRGDVVVVTETRQCDEVIVRQGAAWYLWVLSARARKRNWRALQKGCRLVSHNSYLAHDTRAGVTLPHRFRLHPYITPTTASFCRSAVRPPARRLVLIDSDVPADVEARVGDACARHGCSSVRVVNRTRSEVAQLLAAADVVIDWCMVGSERMPIEAVLCGAVMLTNECMGGADKEDFPIPRRNVLPAATAIDELPGALARILANLPRERLSYTRMRQLYTTEITPAGLRREAANFLEAHQRGIGAHYKTLYSGA